MFSLQALSRGLLIRASMDVGLKSSEGGFQGLPGGRAGGQQRLRHPRQARNYHAEGHAAGSAPGGAPLVRGREGGRETERERQQQHRIFGAPEERGGGGCGGCLVVA